MSLLHTIVYPCRKATELMERSTVAPLSPIANLRLWMHKRMCEACALFAEQSKTIDALMDKRGTQGPLPDTAQLEEHIIRSVPPDHAQ
jgi:hypothetical protein